jgi:cobalt-zinc-cadmium efflux system outer membrane protein
VERSLDLAAARHDARRAGRALGLARPLGFLGEVEAGVSAEREPEGEWLGGPAVSLPIPLFNQGQPQVARAAAELRRLRERYAATEVALRSRVRSAHAAVLASRRRADDYHKLVLPLRQRVLDETQLQYNAMQVGAFQLLAARQQQIEAGESYVRALRDYWLARTQLDQLLQGKLTTDAPVAAPEGGIARGGAAGAEGSH